MTTLKGLTLGKEQILDTIKLHNVYFFPSEARRSKFYNRPLFICKMNALPGGNIGRSARPAGLVVKCWIKTLRTWVNKYNQNIRNYSNTY